MTSPVLQVENLRAYYHTSAGVVKAVRGVSFHVGERERLGLVGESGCGKTTTALALMRMLRQPGKIEEGRVLLDGRDLIQLSAEEMRKIRFDGISLIPQAAMNALNPVLHIRDQITDLARAHDRPSPTRERLDELLESVGLKPSVADMYPHELSGGMRQRVCIAMAITLRPRVIIADEPTSALDVVVQRRVMETLDAVQEDLGASVILVGHDIGLMAQFVDFIGVMYAGKLVELGPMRDVLANPLHPYTQLLIASLPSLDAKRRFVGIPGLPPSLLNPPPGCPFHPRCPEAADECAVLEAPLTEVSRGRWVSCDRCGV
jgi:oligopeptide/dipeptide ABC transporter ATP-binding protein